MILQFAHCQICFRDWKATSPHERIAELIKFLQDIGEPFTGTWENIYDLHCKQVRCLRLELGGSRHPQFCCDIIRHPWYAYFMRKYQDIAKEISGGATAPQLNMQILLFQYQRKQQKFNNIQAFHSLPILADDFRNLCEEISKANAQPSNSSLAAIAQPYNRTMTTFKYLRAVLPEEIDRYIHWRGTP